MTKDSLHELIKGLSTAEKRYVRLYALRSGHDSNHVALFDALLKHNFLTDAELKKAFPKATWSKNLAVSKNHLKHLVLDALVHFHRENDTRSEIELGIRKALQLKEKGLKMDAIDMLRKLQQKAEDDLLWMVALTAVQWRKSIQYADGIEINRELLKLEQQYLSFIQNESTYYGLIRELLALRLNDGAARTAEKRKQLNKLKENVFVTTPAKAETLIAKYFYATFHGILCMFTNDNAGAEKHYLAALKLLRSNPALLKGRPDDYFFRLNSYVSKLSAKGHTPEFKEWLKNLRASVNNPIFFRIKNLKEQVIVYSANHELQAYYHGKDYAKGSKHARELFKSVTEVYQKVDEPYRLVFLFNGMLLHLMEMKFSDSLPWIKAIETMPGTGSSVIRTIGRLCNMMVRYELGDFDLLESLLRSTSRVVRTAEGAETEKAIIQHYLKLLSANKTSHQQLWNLFEKKMTELSNLESEKPLFAYFDFLEWLRKKHSQTSLK